MIVHVLLSPPLRSSRNRDFLRSDVAELNTELSNGKLRVIADSSLTVAASNPELFTQVLSTLLNHAQTRSAEDTAVQEQHIVHRAARQSAFVAVTICEAWSEVGHVHSGCHFDDTVWAAYALKMRRCRICFSAARDSLACHCSRLQPRQLMLKQRLQVCVVPVVLRVAPSSAPKSVIAGVANLTVSTDAKKSS